MSLFAAFLRGMNVGGHRLTNAELQSHFTAMGFDDVATFRASGNVVFASGSRSPEAIRRRIEDGLQAALGYAVPAFIRTGGELRAIAARQPFDAALVAASAGKLQVVLLSGSPAPKARSAALALASDSDRLDFGARELFWLPSGGLLESPLALGTIEDLLGPMTIRTKGTIEQIAARHLTP